MHWSDNYKTTKFSASPNISQLIPKHFTMMQLSSHVAKLAHVKRQMCRNALEFSPSVQCSLPKCDAKPYTWEALSWATYAENSCSAAAGSSVSSIILIVVGKSDVAFFKHIM
jgi:hypothetical protein